MLTSFADLAILGFKDLTIGVGERSVTGLPSLRTVRAVLPHTALPKMGFSFKRLA